KETITQGIESIIEPLLSDKALSNIHYEICFVEAVEVNADTGKKPLIIKQIKQDFDIINSEMLNFEAINSETVEYKAV
ncbi:MAG: hypothetical protein K2O13_01255, partial [Lachnospiraceae bacterium]|nr:hypothetical protein [Lachnospiraceae bacterium]